MSSQMGKLSPKYQTLCAGLRHKHVWAKQKSRGLWKSRPAKERGALQRRPRGPAQRLEMLPLDVVPPDIPLHIVSFARQGRRALTQPLARPALRCDHVRQKLILKVFSWP